MREKDFYIEEISNLLRKFDNDSVVAVYNSIRKLSKGDFINGLEKKNN